MIRESDVVDQVKRTVAEIHRLKVADLEGHSARKSVVRPRHIAMHLAYEMTTMGYGRVGLEFGPRDYSTVRAALAGIRARIEEDGTLALAVDALRERIAMKLPEWTPPVRDARSAFPADCRSPETLSRPAPDRSRVKERKCLKCREDFLSDGPGNRLCAHCRGRNAAAAPIMEGMVW